MHFIFPPRRGLKFMEKLIKQKNMLEAMRSAFITFYGNLIKRADIG